MLTYNREREVYIGGPFPGSAWNFSEQLFFGTLLDDYLLAMKIYHGDLLDKALYAGPWSSLKFKFLWNIIRGTTWPTKYTALYVTFWKPKLRGQFSENLELWIYEFFFNSGDKISKENKLLNFWELKI